jgi:hypothetical protein
MCSTKKLIGTWNQGNVQFQDMYGLAVPRSNLYRHLKQVNATRIKLGALRKKVRNDGPAIIPMFCDTEGAIKMLFQIYT